MPSPELDELAAAAQSASLALEDLARAERQSSEAEAAVLTARNRARTAMDAAGMNVEAFIPAREVVHRLRDVVYEMYSGMSTGELESGRTLPLDEAARSQFINEVLPVMCDVVFRVAFNNGGGQLNMAVDTIDATLTTQAIYQFEAILARLGEVRALGVAADDESQLRRTSIGGKWLISGSRVGKLIDDEFVDSNMSHPRSSSSNPSELEVLRLNEEDLTTLSWAVLFLMDRDIEAQESTDPRLHHNRNLYRSLLGGRSQMPVPQESDLEAWLRQRLHGMTPGPHAVISLVELCACEPWGSIKQPLEERTRMASLTSLVDAMPTGVYRADIDDIDRNLKILIDPKGNGLRRWSMPVGAMITALKPGLAEPGASAYSAGSAIGSMMGLSGAVGTSAGTTWLNNASGNVARSGMAAGTALLFGDDALPGICIGPNAVRRVPKNVIKAEAGKLLATTSLLKGKGTHSPEMKAAYEHCVAALKEWLPPGSPSSGGAQPLALIRNLVTQRTE